MSVRHPVDVMALEKLNRTTHDHAAPGAAGIGITSKAWKMTVPADIVRRVQGPRAWNISSTDTSTRAAAVFQ